MPAPAELPSVTPPINGCGIVRAVGNVVDHNGAPPLSVVKTELFAVLSPDTEEPLVMFQAS